MWEEEAPRPGMTSVSTIPEEPERYTARSPRALSLSTFSNCLHARFGCDGLSRPSPYSPVETSQRRRRGSFIQEDETCRKDELPIASVMNKYFWADLSVKASLQRILIHKGKQRYASCKHRYYCRYYIVPSNRHYIILPSSNLIAT